MKKIKTLVALAVLIAVIVIACKKSEISSGTMLNQQKNEEINIDRISSSSAAGFGECATKIADSVGGWVRKYGAGGSKAYDIPGGQAKLSGIISDFQICEGTPPSDEHPVGPQLFNLEAFEVFAIHDAQDLLDFLYVTSLCNPSQVSAAKAFVGPLNVIINRAATYYGDTYYTASGEERFSMILSTINSGEAYLLENGLGFMYLVAMSSFPFNIPHIVAQKLFNLSPSFVGSPELGLYATLQRWNGFIIDCSQTSIAGYCPSSAILLPGPLQPNIFYQPNYSLLGQYRPHPSTPIFLNSADEKYYADSTYINFVPDGYYDSPNEINGISHKYYHIINGSITEILNIIVDPDGPIEPIIVH